MERNIKRRRRKITIREVLDPMYIKGSDSYKLNTPDIAHELALLGLTDGQLALAFGVVPTTISAWKRNYPEFREMVEAGRTKADAAVAKALYQRAVGYSHVKQYVSVIQKTGEVITTDITEHCPPDVTACIKWLQMRQKELWGTSKTEVDISIVLKQEELNAFSDEELETIERLGLNQLAENIEDN